VEARVLDGNRADRSVQVRAGIAGDVEADVLGAAEERLVRPLAAPDVEDPPACTRGAEPLDERLADGVLRRRETRLERVLRHARLSRRPRSRPGRRRAT